MSSLAGFECSAEQTDKHLAGARRPSQRTGGQGTLTVKDPNASQELQDHGERVEEANSA
jgi:hypothetical protein